MSWTLLDSGTAASANTVTAVVSGKVGTGAELIVVLASKYSTTAFVSGDLTDSSTNSYTAISQSAGADSQCKVGLFYKIAPAVSGSMSFTFNEGGGATFPAIVVYIFNESSGSTTFGTSVATGTISSGTIQPGSIGSANDLVVEGISYYSAGTTTIDSSFSTPDQVNYSAGVNIGVSGAWKEVGASVNPIWTLGAGIVACGAIGANWTGSGGGGSSAAQNLFTLLGVGI